MEGPLSVVFKFSHPTDMMLAVLIGVGFGFVLERAGFGRADNLAAIFYGRDFRVLRVMFSAIVTAMCGLYLLDLSGVLPLSSIGILDTYLGAQIARGCTSGQALTGGAQLALGSWVFMFSVFAGAYALAYFVRRQWI